MSRRCLFFLLAGVALGVPHKRLGAQGAGGLYTSFGALSGWETQVFNFTPGIGTKSVSQWQVPVVVVTPLGSAWSLDLTTHYAGERLESYTGDVETLSGFTDTQLRLLFSPSRDRLMASISFNLPTGQHSVPTSQFGVAGAIGSNYLSFPIANVGTSFGVTSGLAYVQHAGSWNLGLSGSVRYLASYSPFSDDTLSYTPGLEVRASAGADRLLGEHGRMLLGFTASTFSTDTYSGTNALVTGSYAPGTRFITDATLLRVVGRCTLALVGWDLYRLAGSGSTGVNPETKENVLNAELHLTWPVSTRLQLEPLVAYRQWNPADYLGGRTRSGGLTLRLGLTDRLSLAATGRYDSGWIFDTATGMANLTGYGASVLLRVGQ